MTRPFTTDEREDMRKILDSVSINLPPDVNLEWDNSLIHRGTLGAFRWWRPDIITLAGDPSLMRELASTAAHELAHRSQYLRNPPIYFALSIPGVRNLTLEREAKDIEKQVDEKLGMKGVNE